MDIQELKQRITRIEQCADDAKRAVQSPSLPQELRESVMNLHQQASQAKHDANADENSLRNTVMQLEQLADRAMQACRNAGNSVDPQTQQSVQKAHGEVSQLKKDIRAGSPA